jgi:hypothetical protein
MRGSDRCDTAFYGDCVSLADMIISTCTAQLALSISYHVQGGGIRPETSKERTMHKTILETSDILPRGKYPVLGWMLLAVICTGAMNAHAQDGDSQVWRGGLSVDSSVTRAELGTAPRANNDKVGVQAFTVVAGSGIDNHGGWIIQGYPVHVYLIWYGNWTGQPALSIVPKFINGLNGSSYTNILTTYWGRDCCGGRQYATNQVVLAGQRFDWYSKGSHLDDTATKDVMTASLGQFGTDNNAVYFILTSPDVRQTRGDQEFCVQYCGYHSDTFRNNVDVKYAFVGDADRCGGRCYFGGTPNGNSAADSMTSVVAHELAEAITDPRPGDTWIDSAGREMADKCSGYNTSVQLPTGIFNVQALWVNSGFGYCAYGL